MPTSKPSAIPKIIVVIFLAVAVLNARDCGGLGGQQRARVSARAQTAPGTVIDLAVRQAADGTLYFRPVVAFALPDRIRRSLQLAEERTDQAYRADEAVTVGMIPKARPTRGSNPLEDAGHVALAVDHGHPGRGFPGRHVIRASGSRVRFRDRRSEDEISVAQ